MQIKTLSVVLCYILLSAQIGFTQEEVKPFNKRIIGGEATTIDKHPWQVAFLINEPSTKNNFLCGGIIIAQRWALTAAHCFYKNINPGNSRVKSGVTDITGDSGWEKIEAIYIHQNYNANSFENDIALIKLKKISKGKVIPRASKSMVLNKGQLFEVSGWGVTKKGTVSEVLRKTMVPYVEKSKCNHKNSYNGEIKFGMICAGYIKGGKDACQGDSGGPLVWHSKDGPLLIGVVSFGKGCAQQNKPGVYTDVREYNDWILTTMKQ